MDNIVKLLGFGWLCFMVLVACDKDDDNNSGESPKADFSVSNREINAGDAADFTDESVGVPNGWEWTFEGGTPESSDVQHPEGIIYSEAGTYRVSLTVKNAHGSHSVTKNNYITVKVPPCESQNPYLNPNLTYGCVLDVEGNAYATIMINNREWMAENLRTSRFNNGQVIPNVTSAEEWANLDVPGWCYYDNFEVNNSIHGKLYNWHAVNQGNLCPAGWHVPTHAEWMELINHVRSGPAFKSSGGWVASSAAGHNASGMTVLPSGYRVPQGIFMNQGTRAHIVSSSRPNATSATLWGYDFRHNSWDVHIQHLWQGNGMSCRCIKDG